MPNDCKYELRWRNNYRVSGALVIESEVPQQLTAVLKGTAVSVMSMGGNGLKVL
jgi:S-formylglutathione hydrolase FrmB